MKDKVRPWKAIVIIKLESSNGSTPIFFKNRTLRVFDFLVFPSIVFQFLSIFRYIPGQGFWLHDLLSTFGPVHWAPPWAGGGLVQARDRSCFPPAHVLLHLPQNPQTVHLPFTVIRAERRCHSIAPNRMQKHFYDFAFRRRHPSCGLIGSEPIGSV